MNDTYICVVGLGYVGLPSATVFANKGVNVVGVDINERKVAMINKGKSYINEPGLQEILEKAVKEGRLKATTSLKDAINKCSAVLIDVPTPVRRFKVDLSYLDAVLRDLSKLLRKGMLVVVESTIPPGTTKNFVAKRLASSGLTVEKDYYLAHVPERIAPGKTLYELTNEPRIVGGYGPESTEKALKLYEIINNNLYPTDATTAEFIKIIENTYRDLNIAYANLLALIAEKIGVDVYEAIKLANTHPRVNIHIPGAGVGGPCLTKDPYMLIGVGLGTFGIDIITIERLINQYMPIHMVELTINALLQESIDPSKSTITIMGLAYKGGVDDTRESPAKYIIEQLRDKVMEIRAHDPYTNESFGAKYYKDPYEALKGSDAVLFVADHKEYKSLNLDKVRALMRTPIIIDGRRIIDPLAAKSKGFKYLGIGYGVRD